MQANRISLVANWGDKKGSFAETLQAYSQSLLMDDEEAVLLLTPDMAADEKSIYDQLTIRKRKEYLQRITNHASICCVVDGAEQLEAAHAFAGRAARACAPLMEDVSAYLIWLLDAAPFDREDFGAALPGIAEAGYTAVFMLSNVNRNGDFVNATRYPAACLLCVLAATHEYGDSWRGLYSTAMRNIGMSPGQRAALASYYTIQQIRRRITASRPGSLEQRSLFSPLHITADRQDEKGFAEALLKAVRKAPPLPSAQQLCFATNGRSMQDIRAELGELWGQLELACGEGGLSGAIASDIAGHWQEELAASFAHEPMLSAFGQWYADGGRLDEFLQAAGELLEHEAQKHRTSYQAMPLPPRGRRSLLRPEPGPAYWYRCIHQAAYLRREIAIHEGALACIDSLHRQRRKMRQWTQDCGNWLLNEAHGYLPQRMREAEDALYSQRQNWIYQDVQTEANAISESSLRECASRLRLWDDKGGIAQAWQEFIRQAESGALQVAESINPVEILRAHRNIKAVLAGDSETQGILSLSAENDLCLNVFKHLPVMPVYDTLLLPDALRAEVGELPVKGIDVAYIKRSATLLLRLMICRLAEDTSARAFAMLKGHTPLFQPPPQRPEEPRPDVPGPAPSRRGEIPPEPSGDPGPDESPLAGKPPPRALSLEVSRQEAQGPGRFRLRIHGWVGEPEMIRVFVRQLSSGEVWKSPVKLTREAYHAKYHAGYEIKAFEGKNEVWLESLSPWGEPLQTAARLAFQGVHRYTIDFALKRKRMNIPSEKGDLSVDQCAVSAPLSQSPDDWASAVLLMKTGAGGIRLTTRLSRAHAEDIGKNRVWTFYALPDEVVELAAEEPDIILIRQA